MNSDEKYLNKYPEDASEMARLVRESDLKTAIEILQLWGSSQRDIGSIAALEAFKRG